MTLYVRQNEVGYLNLEVRDRTNALVDADVDTLSVLVTDADGVALAGYPKTTAAHIATGIYRFNFDATGLDVGHYIATWTALIGGESSTSAPPEDIYVTAAVTVDESSLTFTAATDLRMTRGDTAVFAFAVTMDGSALDLTGAAVRFTAKRSLADTTTVLSKTIGDGLTLVDAAGGRVDLTLNPADTRDLAAPSALIWDLEVTEAGGYVSTPLIGTLRLDPDVRETGTGVATGWLLDVAQFREHVRSSAPDSAIQRLLDANTLAINERAGPVGSVTLTLRSNRDRYIFLDRPAASITSIVEYYPDPVGISGVTLDSTDYRLLSNGTLLERWGYGTHPGDWWSERVELTYTAVDDTAERIRVLIKLMQLDLNREPGLSGVRRGEYQEQQRGEAYNDEREAILASLVPSALTFA